MKTNIILNTILLIFTSFIINAQVKSIGNNNSRKEKLYLNVNKNIYTAGENINISLYILNANTNAPSNISKTAYIELINSKDQQIKKIEIPIQNNLGTNNLLIPKNIRSGEYKIIAYSKLMKDNNEYSKKNIIISKKKSDLNTFPKEKIFAHFNKDIFSTGEIIKFALYTLNEKTNTPSNISKVAYVELIDSKKQSVKKIKVWIDNNSGISNLFINNNLSSGSYKIIAYTKWMLNFNTFFEKDIMIYNPFKEDIKTAKYVIQEKDNNITHFLKEHKKTRSLISFKLSDIINKTGNYSISVTQHTPSIINSNIQKNNRSKTSKLIYIPEIRGETISGKLTSKEENIDFSKTKMSLSVIDKDGFSQITNVDKNGNFIFVINKQYSSDKIYIQVLNTESPLDISIDKFSPNTENLIFKDFIITDNIASHIKNQAIYNQINNAYKIVERDSINLTPLRKNFSKKNLIKEYVLNDYTRFNSMKETFKEIIIGAWIDHNKENVSFHVETAKYSTKSYSKALVLIDGFLINNHKDLLNLKTDIINSITLYKGQYKFNGVMYNGVILLNTFNNDYNPKSSSLVEHSAVKSKSLPQTINPDYLKDAQITIPNFNTNLFFNNKLQGNEQISFYTSDIKGLFDINIEGFTDNGNLVKLKKSFIVK